MPSLQGFIKRNDRTGSPQHGQPSIKPDRRAIAENARVSVRSSRPPTAQGLSGRGESLTQHQSAPLQQQHLQRRPSGEGRKRESWDTDASSLDSTTNHSIVQVENSPQVRQQQLQPDIEGSETGDDEEVSEEDEYDEEEFEIDESWEPILAKRNMTNASHRQRVQFLKALKATEPQLFVDQNQPLPTIDGDSYPTTTDGNPTEWGEQREVRFEDLGSPSLSPPRPPPLGLSTSLLNQQVVQQRTVPQSLHTSAAMLQSSNLYSRGQQIRGQQRTDGAAQVRGQLDQQHDSAYPPTSQPPTYSQANPELGYAAPVATQARQDVVVQRGQVDQSQRVSRLPAEPGRTQNPIPKINEPNALPRHTSTTRANVVPVVQQQVEPPSAEEDVAGPVGDYDPDDLFGLDYKQLREESFDKVPREVEPVLPEDMVEKPLDERLQFAHQHLGPVAQSDFFGALPTNEWEDAGDWFLDRFSEIIKKTKDARQNKRKIAQGIENEIEKRHKHVAKKQRLVEDAMAKMKTQGEGLVPKSPRASKSPRPKRR